MESKLIVEQSNAKRTRKEKKAGILFPVIKTQKLFNESLVSRSGATITDKGAIAIAAILQMVNEDIFRNTFELKKRDRGKINFM